MTLKQLVILNLIVFFLGGLIATFTAFGDPPTAPVVANPSAPTPLEAEAVADHQLETQLRTNWRTGFWRGVTWALTMSQIFLAIIAVDLAIAFFISPKPSPLKRLFPSPKHTS